MSSRHDPPWPATGFLGQLSEATQQAALRLGTLRHFSSGDIVIQEGAPSDYAVLLLSGSTRWSDSWTAAGRRC